MARVADRDATEQLDALGEEIDERELLLGVLVEQQVQLVEGRTGHVPVVLLVQRVEDRRVGEDLVQGPAAVLARLVRERDRQVAQRPEALDLLAERRVLRGG